MAPKGNEAMAASISGYAAGYLPLPLLVTAVLLLGARHDSRSGSVSVLWVLIVSIPALLLLGPWNLRRALIAYGDQHAGETARAAAVMGVAGLVLEALALVPLLYVGWIGLVVDVALPAVVVPAMARGQVLGKLDEARQAQRLRRRTGRPGA